MCEPVSAGIILGGAMIGGSVYKGAKEWEAGQEAGAIADYNAAQANMQAQDALARGNFEAGVQRLKTGALEGQQTVSYAANQIDTSVGTPKDVIAQTALIGEEEARIIKSNAVREAYGYKTKATEYKMQGKYARQRGEGEMLGSILGGIGSGIGTGVAIGRA